MGHDLEKYQGGKKEIEQRKHNYLAQLTKGYPNLKKLTPEEYKYLQNEFDFNRIATLEILMEKSIGLVLESVANIFAKHNIEDVLPIEDALNECIINVSEHVMDFNILPHYYSEYANSIISYLCFVRISRVYNNEKHRTDFVDLFLIEIL